ncbi:MAG: SH3 domain-containing protein [Oscillospiraceae bacterium]|nr:SH3 domain-containing protein [Oscillospiraceae bacterium]
MVTCKEITSWKRIEEIGDYLLLDLETTGPDPERDRIVELGMVRVTDGEIVNKACTLINPEIPIPAEAAARTGISDGDVAGALTYGQIASSIANLLFGKVAAAERVHMDFIRTLLEEEGCSGEIEFIDVSRILAEGFPELEGSTLDEMADYFDIVHEEFPRVLQDSVIRHELLRAWKEAGEPEEEDGPAPAGAYEDEEDEAEAEAYAEAESEEPAAPARSHAKKQGRGSDRGAAIPVRFLSNGRRKKSAPKPIPLSTWEIIWSAVAVVCLLAALFLIPSLSSLFLLLAGIVFCPFRPLREWLSRFHIKSWMYTALGVVLVVAAILARPAAGADRKSGDQKETPPPYIILTWNEAGAYGQEVTVDPEADPPETYIAFRIPAGRYRVLNNNANAATVTIRSDNEEEEEIYQEPESEFEETIVVQRNGSYTILGNKSQEVTVYDDQYVTLSEKAEKVIFQYLSEIPVEEESESSGVQQEKEPDVIAYVNGKEVRMRRSPSVDAYIMTTYDTGKEVVVLGVNGDWTQVRVDNRTGYIYSKYLTDTNPLAPAEPSAEPSAEPTAEAGS